MQEKSKQLIIGLQNVGLLVAVDEKIRWNCFKFTYAFEASGAILKMICNLQHNRLLFSFYIVSFIVMQSTRDEVEVYCEQATCSFGSSQSGQTYPRRMNPDLVIRDSQPFGLDVVTPLFGFIISNEITNYDLYSSHAASSESRIQDREDKELYFLISWKMGMAPLASEKIPSYYTQSTRRQHLSVGSGLVATQHSVTLFLAQYYELDTPRSFPRSNSSFG
ncbi:hypothetical protein K449DRAFT_438328 [Hypoxylon sp. EC38]|nr:hypothetical protein K449DRAFT_438328 [Hypoxylon sp. EC38]